LEVILVLIETFIFQTEFENYKQVIAIQLDGGPLEAVIRNKENTEFSFQVEVLL